MIRKEALKSIEDEDNPDFFVGTGIIPTGIIPTGIIPKSVITISPHKDEQLQRLMILLGTIKSGNNNPNILPEFTALLDAMIKDKRIDTRFYKKMMKKHMKYTGT